MINESDKETIFEGLSFVFGVFLYALCFNTFLIPNDLVVSGFSGVAIVTQRLFGWNPQVFIYVTNFILLGISFIFLNWKTTKKNIVGSIMFPLMITITTPVANFLNDKLIGDDFLIILLFSIILYGISSGLIYRSGFSTGGSDIIMQIINKYIKAGESKAMIVANSLIILLGMIVFGFDKGVYSFIILIISTYFIDKIMFGISDSKVFYIYTKKVRKIKKLILEDFKTGLTIIPSRGGYSKKRGHMIMCVVGNQDYYKFKERILEIDPNAFIIINKCYEVNGGVKRSSFHFI
ncbi:MAG TPA: YitT family protein [Candidatus Onthocola stercorigallinarum]|nr:YitT family protein [Candidatus Onthocola stercorigallinarum]